MAPPITILGAGALGRLWAARFARLNIPCQFLRRHADATALAYAFRDLALTVAASEAIHIPTATDNLDGLIIVATKAQDTLQALRQHAPRFGQKTKLVLFQNGLGSQADAVAAFPTLAVFAAVSTEGSYRPSPDMLIHAGHGHTRVGALNAQAQTGVDEVVTQLISSGLTVRSEVNINNALWQKLMVNAMINPFTALLDCPNGEILNKDLFVNLAPTLSHEIAAVAKASGIDITAQQVFDNAVDVVKTTAKNISSMLQDVRAGRVTEIDFINGYLARAGQCHDITCPANSELTERVNALNSRTA